MGSASAAVVLGLVAGVFDVHSEPHSHSQFSCAGLWPSAGNLIVLRPSPVHITSSSGAGCDSRPASIFAIATADIEPCSTSNDATTRRKVASQRLCLKVVMMANHAKPADPPECGMSSLVIRHYSS
jgi:hypothetical protein